MAAVRGDLPVHHTRAYVHARHLARVQYRAELERYHVELRQWRHLLVVRERLVRKLASIERRLAHPAKSVVRVFEINGTWFRHRERLR